MTTFKKNIIWSYLSQLLNIAGNLLLIPVILKFFDTEEIGVWYFYLAVISAIQIIDFSLQPTLTRNIIFAFNGAEDLNSSGLPSISHREKNIELIENIECLTYYLYKKIFFFSVFMATVIYVFIPSITGYTQLELFLSWMFFATGQILFIYSSRSLCFILASGNIVKYHKIFALSRFSYLSVATILIVLTSHIISLGIASLLGGIICLKLSTLSYQLNITSGKEKARLIFEKIKLNFFKLLITQVGTFLAVKANILICTFMLGLETTAKYGLTLSVFNIASALALSVINVTLPKIITLQTQKSHSELVQITKKTFALSLSTFLFVSTLIFLIYQEVMGSNRVNSDFVSFNMIIVLYIISMLELNHSISTIYLTSKNKIDFMIPALISGISIVILGVILTKYLGLWGLILAQGFVQAIYNNWKWPYLVLNDLIKQNKI